MNENQNQQLNQNVRKTRVAYPVRYEGNIVILILALIIWMPLGIILWMKNGSFIKGNSKFFTQYHGNYFWLFFWSIIFFPIAIALLFINGVDWIEERQEG